MYLLLTMFNEVIPSKVYNTIIFFLFILWVHIRHSCQLYMITQNNNYAKYVEYQNNKQGHIWFVISYVSQVNVKEEEHKASYSRNNVKFNPTLFKSMIIRWN